MHGAQDLPSPLLAKLLRRPYPAQSVAISGIVRRLSEARSAAVVAECGTGKTLISLASLYVASGGKRFVALAMVPSHLTPKWLREGLTTIPGLRAFVIDGLRNASSTSPNGIHEVKLRHGGVVREGLKTTLTDLRDRKNYPSARARWNASTAGAFRLFEGGSQARVLMAACVQCGPVGSLPGQCSQP